MQTDRPVGLVYNLFGDKVFWSANNYSMPVPVLEVKTKIEYWYGEEEKTQQ